MHRLCTSVQPLVNKPVRLRSSPGWSVRHTGAVTQGMIPESAGGRRLGRERIQVDEVKYTMTRQSTEKRYGGSESAYEPA
jgi:hypothetical protein